MNAMINDPVNLEDESAAQEMKAPFVITIASGKGGVGKSVLAANLGNTLARGGAKVLIWDADMNFPNQHLLHGVEPPVRLLQVYTGKVSAATAIFNISENLDLLADLPATGETLEESQITIIDAYRQILLDTDYDIIILDTPAGASEHVIACCSIADIISVVITDEPTSLLDAYGLVKILLNLAEASKIKLLVNNVIDYEDAEDISAKLNLATDKFLQLQLDVLGFVPYDRIVRLSILQQELFTNLCHDSEVSAAIAKIADRIMEMIPNDK